jgi:hypothetical protein
MKGIIFILLEKVVTEAHGEDTWDALLEKSGASGVYNSLGSYPDEELGRLVTAAAALTGKPEAEILRWFGRKAMPLLRERYSAFFEKHHATVPFILTLNDIIHPEVRKVYPGAEAPDFTFIRSAPGELEMVYRSRKRMCALAEGLVLGAADVFGEEASIDHHRCMHRGDESCQLACRFVPKAA